jgi:hypothetical protein
MIRPTNIQTSNKPPPLTMTGAGDEVNPSTFREAEVLGLKLMQEQKYKEALKGKRGFVCVDIVLFVLFFFRYLICNLVVSVGILYMGRYYINTKRR